MNTNFEKVPAVIFDWIEKVSFEHLSHAQKKEVLLHFSEEDYSEMHRITLSLKTATGQPNSIVNNQSRTSLLAHFDKHHAAINEKRTNKGLVIWQAAAVLLMLLSGWLFYQVFGMEREFSLQQVASTDTVYVTKEVRSEPEIIHDTVYRYKEVAGTNKTIAGPSEDYIKTDSIEILDSPETSQMTECEKLNSSSKGNSMKDDSLLRRFGFVAM